MNIEVIAEEIYTAYCDGVGGKAFNGTPLPSWKEFAADPDKQKQAEGWRCSARKSVEVGDGYHTLEELYEHRHRLFLFAMGAAGKDFAWFCERHADGASFPGWFIAGVNLPAGTISYHMPARLLGDARMTLAKCLPMATEPL